MVIVKEGIEENIQAPDMTREKYDYWMTIDEHGTVTSTLTEKDILSNCFYTKSV